MKLRTVLAGLLFLATSASALAAGPYVGAAGGVSLYHDSDYSESGTGTVQTEYDAGYGFAVNAGYDIDPVRLELEFAYRKADLDKVDNTSVSNADLTVMSYMFNAILDIKTGTPITPYLGIGLGVLSGELEVEDSSEHDNQFGYQALVGASYNFNRNFAFDLSYRYQCAPSDFEKDAVTVEYQSSTFLAGLRYTF